MKASDTLRLLAPMYEFIPEEWHYRLADLTTAMTVCGIFRHATFEFGLFSETLVIKDEEIRKRAKTYMREVAMARRTAVVLYDPQEPRPQDSPLANPEKAIVEFKKKPPGWVDARTLPAARERLSQMMKERHARKRAEKEEKALTQKEVQKQIDARLEKLKENPPKRKSKGPDKRLKNREKETT